MKKLIIKITWRDYLRLKGRSITQYIESHRIKKDKLQFPYHII